MKLSFFSALIVIVFLFSCNQKNEPQNEVEKKSDTTIIAGKITNYNPDSLSKTLKIRLNDVTKYFHFDEYISIINSKGEFKFKFKSYLAGEATLFTGNELYSFYYYPGDSIYIEYSEHINYESLDSLQKSKYKSRNSYKLSFFHLAGDSKEINKAYKEVFLTNEEECPWDYTKAQTLNPEEYQKYINTLTLKRQKNLELKLQNNTIPYKYKSIISNLQIFQHAEYLLYYYPYYSYVNNKEPIFYSENVDTLNTLKKEINKTQSLNSYFAFLRNLPESFEIDEINTNRFFYFMHELDNLINALAKDSCSYYFNEIKDYQKAYNYQLKTIKQYSDGIYRELLLTRCLNKILDSDSIHVFNLLYPKFKKEINTPEFIQSIENYYKDKSDPKKNNYFEIIELKKHKIVSELFTKLSKLNDSVLYVDLWATTCEPCIRQMEFMPEIKEKTKYKNIKFIYICQDHGSERWKKMVSKFKISGEHIELSNDEFSYLLYLFKKKGIPAYFIIDTKGRVLYSDQEVPRPSDSKELVNKLLKLAK